MKAAFVISVTYAILGFLYAPGIRTFVALLFIGFSCLPLIFAGNYEPRTERVVLSSPSFLIYWGIWTLGIVNLAIIAAKAGMLNLHLFSFDGLISVSAASTASRYGEQSGSGNPVLLALSLFLVYRVGSATAVLSAWRKLLSFFPLVFYALLSTEKWPLFLGVAFFISAIFVTHPYRKARNISFRYTVLIILVATPIFGLAVVLRGNAWTLGEMVMLLLHYILAPYPAFGDWLINDAFIQCCKLGALTFIGPLDALGLITREQGVYRELFTIYGLDTNIFTAWRYWVQDFSLVAPLVLNSILALIYISARSIKLEAVAVAIKCFTVISASISVNVTPFVHNTTALSLVLAMFFSIYEIEKGRLTRFLFAYFKHLKYKHI